MRTPTISLPIREPWLTWLRDLRQGRRSRTAALETAADLEARIVALLDTSPLPADPDMAAVNRWLLSAHRRAWSTAADSERGASVPE